jgi:hypothetical protein
VKYNVIVNAVIENPRKMAIELALYIVLTEKLFIIIWINQQMKVGFLALRVIQFARGPHPGARYQVEGILYIEEALVSIAST